MKISKKELEGLDDIEKREYKGRKIFENTLNPCESDQITKVEGSLEEDFTVTNSKGGKHTVRLVNEDQGECDCMDFVFGHGVRMCKHVYAAMFLSEKQKMEI
jgi:hypothetical protein